MRDFATTAASEHRDEERAPYTKPQLTQLGNVGDLTKASSSFANISDSSNILGSDYS